MSEELLNSILNIRSAYRPTGNTRTNSLEQYYTIPEVADSIVERLKHHLIGMDVIEPAGGTGSFVDAISKIDVKSIYSIDVQPKHSDVKRGDFLKSKIELNNYVCITNPPFGRAHSLSVKFFNKAAQLGCNKIIFLISASFGRPAIIDRLDKNFHLIDQFSAPDTSYMYDSKKMDQGLFKSIVQVWERKPHLRDAKRKISTNFRFISRHEVRNGFKYTFSIRKYGSNIGEVFSYGKYKGMTITDINNVKHNNPYTCLFIHSENEKIELAARNIDWKKYKDMSGYIPGIDMSIVSIEIDDWLKTNGV